MAAKKRVAYFKGRIIGPETEWVATYVDWTTEEDSFDEGFIGNGNTVLAESINVRAKRPDQLLQKLSKKYYLSSNKEAWTVYDDGRIQCEFLVDANNSEASQRQIDAWKLGQERLWMARVDFGIEEVTVHKPTVEELAADFGIEDAS